MSGQRFCTFVVFCAGCLLAPAMLLAFDSDGDGVDDDLDVCCDTPAGIEVDEFGRPIGDLDGDCDVDLDDFALVQTNLTGPLLPGCCSDLDCNDGDPCTVDACDETGTCLHHDIPDCTVCHLVSACREELVCDVADLNEILVATDTHNLCFCVTDGEGVRITVIEEPGSGVNFSPNWRLVDSDGNPAIECGAFTSATIQLCGPLPAAASPYRVQVEDAGRNDVGSYRAHLQRLQAARACDDLPLECDVPVTTTLDSVVDTDLLRFDAADGEIVRVNVVKDLVAPAALNPEWRLIDGAGNPAPSCGVFAAVASAECGPLRFSLNPYRVEIEDNGRNGAGLVHAALQRLTAVRACENQPVACGVPVTTEIEDRLDSDLFSFRAADGELVRITVVEPLNTGGVNFTPAWRLVDGAGFTGANVPCGSFSSTVGVTCGPLWSSGNPYRIELNDSGQNDVGELTI